MFRDKKERFILTTGLWLIDKYLREGEHKRFLIDAIENGDIRWHAMPFTAHTEFMNADLFNYIA